MVGGSSAFWHDGAITAVQVKPAAEDFCAARVHSAALRLLKQVVDVSRGSTLPAPRAHCRLHCWAVAAVVAASMLIRINIVLAIPSP